MSRKYEDNLYWTDREKYWEHRKLKYQKLSEIGKLKKDYCENIDKLIEKEKLIRKTHDILSIIIVVIFVFISILYGNVYNYMSLVYAIVKGIFIGHFLVLSPVMFIISTVNGCKIIAKECLIKTLIALVMLLLYVLNS